MIQSIILGIVQGLTEFLPVSSDGHLTVTHHIFARLSGQKVSGEENLFFDLMLHLGTLAAILLAYRKAIVKGARGMLGAEDVPESFRRPALFRVAVLVFVSLLPLIPYVKFKHVIERAFESLVVTGAGFLVTAAALLVTHFVRGGTIRLDRMKAWHALAIGVAQAFAPLPGVSRSGMTIAMALVLGFDRAWAVDFSLLIAVPAILGASVVALKDFNASTVAPEQIAPTIAAMVVAGAVGYLAIQWLVKSVRAGKIWYFSIYLVLLGIGVLIWGLRVEATKQPVEGGSKLAGVHWASGPGDRARAR